MDFDLNTELANRKIGWRHQAEQQFAEYEARMAVARSSQDEASRVYNLQYARTPGLDAARNFLRAESADRGLLFMDINDLEFEMNRGNHDLINEARSQRRVEEFAGDSTYLVQQLKRGQGGLAMPGFKLPKITDESTDFDYPK